MIPGSSWSASSPSGRARSSPRSDGSATRPAPSRRSSSSTVADLPERPEAWSALDRLVWQDVDAGQLSAEQLAALRTWLAGGGRLTIVGGSGGLGLLAGFPDELLPFRPTVTVDVDPESIRGLLGGSLPRGAEALPGPRRLGERRGAGAGHGRRPRDRRRSTPGQRGGDARRLRPDHAVARREHLRRRPVGVARPGAGRRRARRSSSATTGSSSRSWARCRPWRSRRSRACCSSCSATSCSSAPSTTSSCGAWTAASGPGSRCRSSSSGSRWPPTRSGFVLRGTEVIVNQVALVRAAPGTDAAQAQVYLGVFSPTRGTLRGGRPGRGAPLRAVQRRGVRPGRPGARRRPGRSGPAAPARRRVRDAPRRAGRGPGPGPPDRGRPAPRGRSRPRDHPERVRAAADEARRRPGDGGRGPPGPGAGRQRDRRPAGPAGRLRPGPVRADLRPAAVHLGRAPDR